MRSTPRQARRLRASGVGTLVVLAAGLAAMSQGSAAVASPAPAGTAAGEGGATAAAPPAAPWGWTAHEVITRAAVDGLPPPLRQALEPHREFLARHSVDPDRWREEGEGRGLCAPDRGPPALSGDEAPRHYIDADRAGAYPFRELPRDLSSYLQLVGDDLEAWGSAPWAIAAYTDLLAAAMSGGEGAQRVLCRAAILAHYVEDLSQPLHLTENYNGQLSGLEGVHFRFESDLPAWYAIPLAGAVERAAPRGTVLDDPLAAAFEMVLEGYPSVDDILRADLMAQRVAPLEADEQGADDPRYMAELWRRAGALAARRMAHGARMVASYWTTAWDRAGRPALRDLPEALGDG